jgi:hypothetical protein
MSIGKVMAKKAPKKLTRNQLKHLFFHYVSHTENIKELPNLFEKEKEQFNEWLALTPPWSFWYELPYTTVIALFLIVTGLGQEFIKATQQADPHQAILDLIDSSEEPSKEEIDQYDEEDKAIVMSLFLAIVGNIKSMQIHSIYLNDLLHAGKECDEKLLDAILIDRTIISSPTAARRIQYAVATHDETFLTALSKAIKNERPRKAAKDLDDVRFIFVILEELGDLEEIHVNELYEVVTTELRAYPGIGGNTLERFRKFYYRYMKSRT